MKGLIYITGEIGVDCTLIDVIKQVKAQSQSTELFVKIDSVGGYVEAGKDIYNYLRSQGKPVTTFTTKAYSIASMIYMAGSVRIVPEGAENALMIHLPWMEAVGNHQEISEYLKNLKDTENDLVDFYSEAIQLDKNTITSLLTQETFLSATQCLELGFATQVQPAQLAVAKLYNKEIKEESLMNKINAKLETLMNLLNGKPAIKAELVLQDATGVELVFPALEATETVAVDAVVTVDGKKAEGDFIMPDGSTITAVAGVVTEVKQVEVEEEIAVDAVEETEIPVEDEKDKMISELQAEIEDLKVQLSQVDESKASVEKMVEVLEQTVNQQTELQNKYNALAKQIGSDFQLEPKETKTNVKTNVKASVETTNRAFQILNSKF